MRAFLDVLRFELRQHFAAPLLWVVTFLFIALNFLMQTRTGINLGDNEKIALNSNWLIFQTQIVLGVFGMVASIIFAVAAQTRDYERNTLEFFFTTPVSPSTFVLGRFVGATLASLFVSCVGLMGAMVSTLMPWLDPQRLLPFSAQPWLLTLTLLVVPNILLFCSLFFAVATLTRSASLTFAAALAVLVYGVVINTTVAPATVLAAWQLLSDPFGALPVTEASRFWTISELNTLLPTTHLLPNRLLWLGIASVTLLFTVWRYRMELVPSPLERLRRKPGLPTTPPPPPTQQLVLPRFDSAAAWQQFRAQWRMDVRGVWQSPFFWILLSLTMVGIWSDASNVPSPLVDLPNRPITGLLLDFFRYSLFQNMLLALVYYSAVLVQRERDCGVDGITGASPCADWIPVVSKTLVLCGIVSVLLLASMLVALAVQELADFHDHYLGVFLQGIFIYNGFHLWMLAVLAVLVQVLSPGKWSGMVMALSVITLVLSLPFLGVEHLLLGFRIPGVTYSDMNGFGHFQLQTWSLIGYWGAFCVLLLVAAHLLFARSSPMSWRERLQEARTRVNAPLIRICIVAVGVFAGFGGFVFYNTNVLNDYVTSDARFAAQVLYEREYARYRDMPTPSLTDPELRYELFPSARSWQSTGSATLRNNQPQTIDEFLLRVDERNHVGTMQIEGATLTPSPTLPWVFIAKPAKPMATGDELTLHWSMTRENKGFANTVEDNDIIANGSYVREGLVPLAGFCDDCRLASNRERKKQGLAPIEGLPALGDPEHLDDLVAGLDARSSFHAIVGTDLDQTVVGAGQLVRSWEENGRRYFEYDYPGPVWPLMVPLTARYTVAREKWNDVDVEVYYDAKHPWNIRAMLDAAKWGLEYYSREFAPYAHPYYRMAEYARYTTRVQAGIGSVAYAEGSGFLADLRGRTALDYPTLHELAHQWWGNDVYGAHMQGQQVLNEGLAQYSTFMALKAAGDTVFLREVLANNHNAFLSGRKGDPAGENPVIKADNQPHIAYGKASMALFMLQELIGPEKVNLALRTYHKRFVAMTPPLPTTLDLVHELRVVAGQDHQQLITDLFEKIMMYDVGVESMTIEQQGSEYAITLDVSAFQYEADSIGAETEAPLDTWFQIVLFAASDEPLAKQAPIYQQFHRLHSGQQQLKIRVPVAPATAAVDPWYLMIDRRRDNNMLTL